MSVTLPNANQPSNTFAPRNKRFAPKGSSDMDQFDERDNEIERLHNAVQSLTDILEKVLFVSISVLCNIKNYFYNIQL